jgi:glycerol-3-phosphate dehydrogenase
LRAPDSTSASTMRRDLSLLTNQRFELLIVGGGVHGACIAWDASLRGLSVAIAAHRKLGSFYSMMESKAASGAGV